MKTSEQCLKRRKINDTKRKKETPKRYNGGDWHKILSEIKSTNFRCPNS